MEQKTHSNRLYCEFCDIKFANRLLLSEHKNVVHADKPYECNVCHKKFGDRFTLKVHFRVHTGEKPYTCPYCNKSFTQACNLSTHKKRYHFRKSNHSRVMPKAVFIKNNRLDDPKRFPCKYCNLVFRRVENVKAHVLSQHISRVANGNNSRSPSTSSGVSSTSSNSEGIQQVVKIKHENHSPTVPVMSLHCKKCKLTFPERVSYQKHMYAHAKQSQSQMQSPTSAIQVSNSSGQEVNLKELVSRIRKSKEEPKMLRPEKDVMQKLTGLGMEISLHPVSKSSGKNDLGLVISSVQSVSQRFFDELESPKQVLRANIAPKFIVQHESPLSRTNGANGSTKTESPIPEDTGDRDPLELPSPALPTSSIKPPASILPLKLKKPKLEPDPGIRDEVILSSTRRTSRGSSTYNEADQPKHISIITKQKNGKTTKRRIFPCGGCACKFENIETRKMHFLTVHNSAAKSRKTPTPPVNEPLPIIPHLIPAHVEDHE